MLEAIQNFLNTTGIARLFADENWWQTAIMFLIAFVLVYLAIVKQFEPLLLLPIAIRGGEKGPFLKKAFPLLNHQPSLGTARKKIPDSAGIRKRIFLFGISADSELVPSFCSTHRNRMVRRD